MIKIEIAKEFSDYLLCRTRADGEYSAEAFVFDLVLPKFKENKKVELDFHGTKGYSSAFLEEAFSLLVYALDMNYNLFTHKFDIITDDPFLISEIEEYVKNPKKMKITAELFKGYYIPIPIPNKIFSMELCEIIDIDVHESVKEYWYTGEVINLVYNESTKKYYLDESIDDFFWTVDGEEHRMIFNLVQEYFTTDKFLAVRKYLYRELLEGKTIVGTMNSYMFLQRFTNISHWSFE